MSHVDLAMLESFCSNISKDIREIFPYLDARFLLYRPGEKIDRINALLPTLRNHPAFDEAASILKFRTVSKDGSGFMGIADGYEDVPFSFKKKRKSLAFIAIDYSRLSNNEEAFLEAYANVSELLDFLSAYKSISRPVEGSILQPKKNQLGICRTNLKADIYGVLQLSRDGTYDAPMRLAKRRSIETLTPQSYLRPEEHPFPLALDVTNYAIENQISSSALIRGTSKMVSQYQLANKISSCFETENILTWMQFVNNSQTMAWSGFSAGQILGAAINTSTNPFIKALGHLLAEITNLSPIDEEHLPQGYNPFLADEINQIRHERQVEETFEMILIHALEADSHLPLIRVANNQNEGLLKGKISGWCASALQAAAKAYIGAKERGVPPMQAARLEFQSVQLQSNWKSLLALGQNAVSMWRKGEAVTMGEIIKWCKTLPENRFILDSLNLTVSDPNYTIRLDAASAMPSLSAEFSPLSTPTVQYAPRTAPALYHAPSLSLGGGNSGYISQPQTIKEDTDQ